MSKKNPNFRYSWGPETPTTLFVSHVANNLSILYEGDLEFVYYTVESPRKSSLFDLSLSAGDLAALESIQKKYQLLDENEDSDETSEPQSYLDLVTGVEESCEQVEERHNELTLVAPMTSNETTSSGLFDDSRDGFDLQKEKKYEGQCREFWYNREQSVDYSSMFEKSSRSSPSPKKPRLSTSPQ